jgi:DNA mismatch endonuclease (patch repair protein)
MSRQASKDTSAELAVRHLLHAAGLRYRVEYPVPGMARRRIDVAFTRAKVAVLIDGTSWTATWRVTRRPPSTSWPPGGRSCGSGSMKRRRMWPCASRRR